MENETRTCLNCSKPVKGRTDKKFCDDYCRSAYNNCRNGSLNNYIRNINYALRRNRRILEESLTNVSDVRKTTKQQLYNKGFDFKYFTHTHSGKKGETYYFCYDMGYAALQEDKLLIIKQESYKHIS